MVIFYTWDAWRARNGALLGYTYTGTETATQTTVREGSFGGKINSAGLVASCTLRKRERTKTEF